MLDKRILENCDSASANQARVELAERKQFIEQLFRRNYSKMIHLASVLLGDDEEAEDLVQDVFLRVADGDIPPKNDYYLLTAVRNACLNRIRQMHLHDKVKHLRGRATGGTAPQHLPPPLRRRPDHQRDCSSAGTEPEYCLQVSHAEHSANQTSLR